MPLIDPLPEVLARSTSGRSAGVAIGSDLKPDGTFGQDWLIVADGRVEVYDGDLTAPRLALELDSVAAAEDENLIGGGALMATTHGRRVELLRYTTSLKGKFGRVARYLNEVKTHREALRKGTSSTEPSIDPDPDEPARCPRCRLLLQPQTTTCPACVNKGKVVLRMLGYLRPHGALAAWTGALMLLGIGAGLVAPYLSRPLMDRVLAPTVPTSSGHRAAVLALVVLGMLLSGVVSQSIAILRGRAMVVLGKRLCHQLRLDVYAHLQLMSLRFFDRRKGGQLVARVTQDTEALESVLVDGAQHFVVNILTLFGIGAVLMTMNWRLTLLVLLPVPVALIASRLFWPRMVSLWHRFYHLRGNLVSAVSETVNGMRVVKAFAKEREEVGRFERISSAAIAADQQADLTWNTFFPILTYITATGSLLVTYFGGLQVISGTLSPGTLIAFTAYLGMFYGPLQWISRIADYLARSITSSARVFEVLDTVPDVGEPTEAVPLPRVQGRIGFEAVVFGYDKHKPALKGLTFTINPGEMVGLVGHSGAGKSTLINLLCRFYDIDAGRILIDGVDLRKVRGRDLRSQIGVVLQDTFLFNGTIAENIAYARPDAPTEDIIAAAKAANAHDFILGKPDAYDTLLGERGQTISGGERQRLAIARAILHDPRILILDEATASVDTDTEKQIQEAVARLVKGRTTIAIAHRLSTLRNADRLIVLKAGEVAEIGTHAELLAKEGGEFRRLVEMQQELSRIVEV